MIHITPHFTLNEVVRTSQPFGNIPQSITIFNNLEILCNELEKIRNYINAPLYINSCFRSPDVNTKVGGVRNSLHLAGRAADVHTIFNAERLYKDILCIYGLKSNTNIYEDNSFEIILYPNRNFVHFAIK